MNWAQTQPGVTERTKEAREKRIAERKASAGASGVIRDLADLVVAATGKPLPSGHRTSGVTMAQKFVQTVKSRVASNAHAQHIELSPTGADGVPVRDLLQALYKRKRDKVIVESFVFLAWAALFFVLIYANYNVQLTLESNQALDSRFVQEPFDDTQPFKTWLELDHQADYWTWMTTVFQRGMYPSSLYNGGDVPPLQMGYVNDVQRVVGAVVLRQFRVRNDSCNAYRNTACLDVTLANATVSCLPRYTTLDGTCFGPYTTANAAMTPFGPPDAPTKYRYSSGGYSAVEGLFGWGVSSYGNGGYVVELPSDNGTAAAAIIAQLIADQWTDRATRAIAINFNVFNTATSMVSVARLLFEQFHTGFVLTSYKFYTFPIEVTQTGAGVVVQVFAVVFVVFVVYWTQKVVKGIWWSRPCYRFFKDFSNLFDCLLVGLNGALIAAVRVLAKRCTPSPALRHQARDCRANATAPPPPRSGSPSTSTRRCGPSASTPPATRTSSTSRWAT